MVDDQQVPRDDQAGPPDDGGAPHETREVEPSGDHGGAASGDPTGGGASDDETAEQAPTDETAVLPTAARAWSGRAEVRPPDAYQAAVRAAAPQDEWAEPETVETGPWWMPIVIAIVALLFLAVLAAGLWLLFRRTDEVPPVTPTFSVVPTVATTPSAATSGPSQQPTSPSFTAPADVVVPRVTGLAEADARALLDSVGLSYRIEYVATSDFAAGTVVTTRPSEGTAVPRGTKLTLVIAAAAPTHPEPSLPEPSLSTPGPSGPAASS